MSKTIRKDYFGWPPEELEFWLPSLLENMRFSEVRVQTAIKQASAVAKEKINLPTGPIDIRIELSITWREQSDGLTFVVTAEEPQCDWTLCLCNRIADGVLGALRTVCEIYHGKDS